MLHIFSNGQKVAEGWSLVGSDLKKVSPRLYSIDSFKYSTSTALANDVIIKFNGQLVGRFLIRDLPNTEPSDDGNFLSKNVLVEHLP